MNSVLSSWVLMGLTTDHTVMERKRIDRSRCCLYDLSAQCLVHSRPADPFCWLHNIPDGLMETMSRKCEAVKGCEQLGDSLRPRRRGEPLKLGVLDETLSQNLGPGCSSGKLSWCLTDGLTERTPHWPPSTSWFSRTSIVLSGAQATELLML